MSGEEPEETEERLSELEGQVAGLEESHERIEERLERITTELNQVEEAMDEFLESVNRYVSGEEERHAPDIPTEEVSGGSVDVEQPSSPSLRRAIMATLQQMEEEHPSGVSEEELMERVTGEREGTELAHGTLNRLKRAGEIYNAGEGYKVV